MKKTKIFINYRREDSAGYVGRLYDRLISRFGKELIFYDKMQSIGTGTKFTKAIQEAITSSDIVLVVLGRLWSGILRERMNDSHNPDYVIQEIEWALSQNKFIIPVLVSGGGVPVASDLPAGIRDMVTRQATVLSDDDFHTDVDKLVETIDNYLSIDLDQVLQDRNAYFDLKERLKDVTELDIYAPSAAAFLDNQNAHIIQSSILNSGGSMRILIQNPNNTMLIDAIEAHEKLHVERMGTGVKRSIENTLDRFRGLGWHNLPNVQLKLLSFYPGFSIVVYNRNKPDSYVSVEIHGYHNEAAINRMHIDIPKSRSLSWFNYWVMQYDKMWEDGQVYNPNAEYK